jgi:putative exosortase-associated protein (TIGR04073 family)
MRYDKSPINKLGRGLLNTVTFFNEVPAGFFTVSAEKDEIAGWTIGLVDGVATSLLRLFSGVFDTVTFILPPYNKPLMTPEYSWQSLEQSRHRYEDSLADK